MISIIGEIKGDQGCPLPWNACRRYCIHEVKTDKGRPCDGLCYRFTCVCLYESACRYGHRNFYLNPNQSDKNY